jgi:hypothetical protein
MEYIFGSIITLISFFVFNKMTKKIITQKMHVPTFTQSRKVELIRDYLFNTIGPKQEEKTQSREHIKKNSRKAFFWLDNVYWIENGFLVTAKLNNNKIDETTKKKVDTHSLDKVELDKITFIVDKLTEGNKDDSGNSGK